MPEQEITYYYCPKHPTVLLLTERMLMELKILVPEKPLYCEKCQKSYFKKECSTRKGA